MIDEKANVSNQCRIFSARITAGNSVTFTDERISNEASGVKFVAGVMQSVALFAGYITRTAATPTMFTGSGAAQYINFTYDSSYRNVTITNSGTSTLDIKVFY